MGLVSRLSLAVIMLVPMAWSDSGFFLVVRWHLGSQDGFQEKDSGGWQAH